MDHLSIRQKTTIMVAIMASMLFAALNQTIVGTILPRIISELKGIEYFQWVFTIYMLTSSITAILVGKLSDLYGRKPFILAGLGVFIIGSFLCGTSSDIIQLILYRGIQGLGGGMVMSTAFTAVGDLFTPRERGRWQGMLGASFGLASILGPTLGGYIVDHMDWHWCFWIFLPFGVVALILIWFLFPSPQNQEKGTIDYAGSLFLTITMVPMLLAFSWAGNQYTWDSPMILGLFGSSLLAFLGFIWIEMKTSNPVLPLQLFKNSVFSLSTLLNFMIGFGMFGAIMYTPFFVQGVMGVSATKSSFLMMPMTLGLVLASIVAGQVISKTGKYKTIALAGLVIMMFGMVSMSLIPSHATDWQIVERMIVIGIGLGIAFPVFTLTAQNVVEHQHLGVATSSVQLFRQLGGTVGVSIMGTVMSSTMKEEVMKRFAQAKGASAHVQPESLKPIAQLKDPQILMDPGRLEAIRNQIPAAMRTLFDQMVEWLREAMTVAIHHVFIIGSIVLLAAFVLTFFLKELPLRTSNTSSPVKQP